MATEPVIDQEREEREAFAGVLRFYELAKRQGGQVRALPWGKVPPIPEGKGSPERQGRRKDMWRSVLTQQLQADMLACEMASQLLNIAPDPEAKLYYSTMALVEDMPRLADDRADHAGGRRDLQRREDVAEDGQPAATVRLVNWADAAC